MDKKIYIKTGEKVYCTGCYLRIGCSRVNGVDTLDFDSLDETMYYDGLPVNLDENGYYVEPS